MFAIISNRRRSVRWWVKLAWTLVLIVLAVGVVILIDRKTKPVSYSQQPQANSENTPPEQEVNNSNQSNGTDQAVEPAANPEQPVADEAKTEEQAAAAPADYDGTDVHYGAVTVKVPKQWFFSYSQESVGQLMNFGTQNYGPENPYQANMADDLSGYIGPIEAIPSESVGPLSATTTLKAKNGQEVTKKVYSGKTPDDIELSQVVYTFSAGDKNLGILSYTQTKNTQQLERLDQMVQLMTF